MRRLGKRCASHANVKHHNETKANCMIVRVIGCGKAFRIDFDDVFVSADVKYQTTLSV